MFFRWPKLSILIWKTIKDCLSFSNFVFSGESKSDGDKPSTSGETPSDDKSENPTSTTDNEENATSEDDNTSEKNPIDDEKDEEEEKEKTDDIKRSDSEKSDDETEPAVKETVQKQEANVLFTESETMGSPIPSVSSESSSINPYTATKHERAASVSSQDSVNSESEGQVISQDSPIGINQDSPQGILRDSPVSHTSTESIGSGLRQEVYQSHSPAPRTSAERHIPTSSLSNLHMNHVTRTSDYISRRDLRGSVMRAGYPLHTRPQPSLLGAPRSAVLDQTQLATPSYFVPPTAATSHPRLPFPPSMGAQPTVPIIPYPSTAAPTQIGAPNIVYANYSNQITPAQDSIASLAQNRLFYGQEQILAGHNAGYQQQMILQQSLVSIPGAHTGLPPGALTKNQPAVPSASTPPRLALPSPPIAPQISPDHKMDPVSQAIYDNLMGKLPNKRKMDLTCDTTDHTVGLVKRFRTSGDVRPGLNSSVVNLRHS